jgi:hypothetical protein
MEDTSSSCHSGHAGQLSSNPFLVVETMQPGLGCQPVSTRQIESARSKVEHAPNDQTVG